MKLRLALAAIVLTLALHGLATRPAEAAVDQISLHQICSGTELRVAFSWQGGQSGVAQEWLDLSLYDNGWQDGTFLGWSNAPRSVQLLTWPGLIQNTAHYVRVNQQRSDGSWEPSRTVAFTTISCNSGGAAQDNTRALAPIEVFHVYPSGSGGAYLLHVVFGVPGCAKYSGFDVSQNGINFVIKVYNTIPSATAPCTVTYGSQEIEIGLGFLQPGQIYNFDVNGKTLSDTPPAAGTGGHTH